MTSRERFLAACRCEPLDRPPIWVMRQAGRYLPEYRALKEKHGFLGMVRDPELATEVTLQPLKRFPLDAAILFSDILVIPEAMGQPYHFRDKGGIGMDFALEDAAAIDRLEPADPRGKLAYVEGALRLLKRELAGEKALLGFGGSPWTLATYMVEGGSSKEFERVKSLFFQDRPAFHRLMEKLVEAISEYFAMKIEAGVDALQIFDSWGSACPGTHYWEMSLRWIAEIIQRLPEEFPVIVYAKGMSQHWSDLARTGARALSVDWTVRLGEFARQLPDSIAVQGNFDPVLLNTTPEIVANEASSLLDTMKGRGGHIFNLGHGILPTAKVENMETLVQTVVSY